MDIFYSTGLKPHLIKSYKDAYGKSQKGYKIWGCRLAQMVLNLISVVAVIVVMVVTRKYENKPKVDSWSLIKVWVWFAVMVFLTLLSISGLPLFIGAKKIKSRFVWIIATGIYNLIHSHIIIYVIVLGGYDFLLNSAFIPTPGYVTPSTTPAPATNAATTTTTTTPPPSTTPRHVPPPAPSTVLWTVCIAGFICLLASTIHFLSALFPTPFPPSLRLQRVAPENLDGMADVTAGKDGEGMNTGGESGTTTMTDSTVGETMSGSVGQAFSPDQTPTSTPNPGATMI